MRLPVALLVLAGAACATDSAYRATPERGPVACYKGIVQVTLPGQTMVLAEYPALVRRTFKQKERQIVEESIVQRPGAIDRHTTTWHVARECKVVEQDGAFSGTCEMQGEPWSWYGWTAVVQRPVLGDVWIEEREEKVTAEGLIARRWTRTKSGTEGPSTIETYESVPPMEFEALWLKAVRSD